MSAVAETLPGGFRIRYHIDGEPYVSVTQLLNLDPDKKRIIEEWEAGFVTPSDAGLHRYRRAIIGTIIHWRIHRWFHKRLNLPLPDEIYLRDDDGNQIDLSVITDHMKTSIDVIWSYFVEWAEEVMDSGDLVPHLVEKRIWHEDYHYAGTFDMMAWYKGEFCLIDWKTSKWIGSHHTYGAQLTAYEKAALRMGLIDKPVDKLIVIRFNEKHNGPDIHPCIRDWERFERCLQYYQEIRGGFGGGDLRNY